MATNLNIKFPNSIRERSYIADKFIMIRLYKMIFSISHYLLFFLSLMIIIIFQTLVYSQKPPQPFIMGSQAHIHYTISRAMTMQGLSDSPPIYSEALLKEDLEMINRIRPRYIGRFAGWWASSYDNNTDDAHFLRATNVAIKIHAIDPNIVLEAAIFEYVNTSVNNITIPEWVFTAFQLPVVQRNFKYHHMLYDDFPAKHQIGTDGGVPDMSRLESRLWFYFRAKKYIDAGAESLHLGQYKIMAENDPQSLHWFDLASKIRKYALKNSRRGFIWLNAHAGAYVTPPGDFQRLLFDFHEAPTWPKQRGDKIEQATIEKNYLDHPFFGKTYKGITFQDEYVETLPYLIELDNFGLGPNPGKPNQDWFPFGYDEITWFSLLSKNQRDNWVLYSDNRIASFANNGYYQAAGIRSTTRPGVPWPGILYRANKLAFDQENAITFIWNNPPLRTPKQTLTLKEVCPIGKYDGTNCYISGAPLGGSPFINQNRFYYKPITKKCPTGTFDGSNCYVGLPPKYSTPFIYNNGHYYSPLKKHCPQGTFDGENCIVNIIPSGANAFIYENRFYYKPFLKKCAVGIFDGANCFLWKSPPGSKPFIFQSKFYYKPFFSSAYCQQHSDALTRCCPQGTFDGANCLAGNPPTGTTPLIINGSFYYQPETITKSMCSNQGAICCPQGAFDGNNCLVGNPTEGTTAFIKLGKFYQTPVNLNCTAQPKLCCPYGFYDGTNCSMGSPPSGEKAFVFQGKYFYVSSNQAPSCPVGTFDGANCLMPLQPPSGKQGFIHNQQFYIKPTFVK